MNSARYDLIIVGGGLGGASLAKVMSEAGAKVLLLEREQAFRDRVRGEGMHAWGVPEAKALGIYDLLRTQCGIEVRWWDIFLASERLALIDFHTATPHGSPLLSFYHPQMQECMLQAARKAGAEVWRGSAVRKVTPGAWPRVQVEHDQWMHEVHARLVVGADGRNSAMRKWGNFDIQHDEDERIFTGVLLDKVPLAEDRWYAVMNPALSQEAVLCPIGQGRVRAYLGHPRAAGHDFFKAHDVPRFLDESIRTGGDRELYRDARAIGPMAGFASCDSWVAHPFKDGIALVGDAASTCDPSFGQGLALTLRGVRLLADELRRTDDWVAAADAYAHAQHRNFDVVRRLEHWYRGFLLEAGKEADKRRADLLPRIAATPALMPNLFGMGPDAELGLAAETPWCETASLDGVAFQDARAH